MTIIRTTNTEKDRDDAVNKFFCMLSINDMNRHAISRENQLRIMALAHGMRTTKVFVKHAARLAWIISFERPWTSPCGPDEASSVQR